MKISGGDGGVRPVLLWGKSTFTIFLIFLVCVFVYTMVSTFMNKNVFTAIIPEVSLFSNKNTLVEYYSMQGCPYCVRFNPEWEKFEKESRSLAVTTQSYDARKDSEKVQKAGVEGFPTVMITKDGKTYTYEGPRTAAALLEEVKK